MRYIGMLLTLAIICVLVLIVLRSLGAGTGGAHDVDWYYAHPTERASQLQWCQQNMQQQDSSECVSAVAAQTRADVEGNGQPAR